MHARTPWDIYAKNVSHARKLFYASLTGPSARGLLVPRSPESPRLGYNSAENESAPRALAFRTREIRFGEILAGRVMRRFCPALRTAAANYRPPWEL